MPPVSLPRHEKLNPFQLWQYFSQPQAFAEGLRASHGALAPIRFYGTNYTLVLTPEGARQVFAQPPGNYEAFWYESFAGMNGEGSLWVLAGEAHRRERRLFAPATHASQFRAYGLAIRDIAGAHFDTWQADRRVKAVETTKAMALDVIMRLVFGVDDDGLLDEGRPILDALTSSAHPLIVFYPKLQRRWFPLFRRYLRAKAAMYDWAERVIAVRRESGRIGNDVLGCLMDAYDQDGRPDSTLHICNELLSILTAGHVTTGVALAWALYELGRHPDIAAKLRAELDGAGDPEPEQLVTLPYLAAVCNEAIRLHPILAECARVPITPVEILGRTIPAGEALVMSIVGIHHDPSTYPEPQRFRPERFLERTFGKTEFMPFGGGHRRCLGAGLAEYTLRIGVAEAVMRWQFAAAGTDYDKRHDLAMGPKYGVPLRISGRRQPRPKATPALGTEPARALAAVG